MYERIGRLACHTKLHGVAGVVLRGSSEDCLSQAVTDQEWGGAVLASRSNFFHSYVVFGKHFCKVIGWNYLPSGKSWIRHRWVDRLCRQWNIQSGFKTTTDTTKSLSGKDIQNNVKTLKLYILMLDRIMDVRVPAETWPRVEVTLKPPFHVSS